MRYNETGKQEALENTHERLTATGQSVAEYIKNVSALTVSDFLKPVGEENQKAYVENIKETVAEYLPGAIRYTINSTPELLAMAKEAMKTKAESLIEYAHLVSHSLIPTPNSRPILTETQRWIAMINAWRYQEHCQCAGSYVCSHLQSPHINHKPHHHWTCPPTRLP